METRTFEVMRHDDGRYVITNAETCEVIDNAMATATKRGRLLRRLPGTSLRAAKPVKTLQSRKHSVLASTQSLWQSCPGLLCDVVQGHRSWRN